MTRFCVLRSERGISGIAASCGNKTRSSGEQFLHHGLLEGAGLLSPLLQRRQLRVHLRQRLGDGSLFVRFRKCEFKFVEMTAVNMSLRSALPTCLKVVLPTVNL